MKPSDLLQMCVDRYLLNPMNDLGFTYSKSQRTFKRKVGDFVQVIYLQPRSRNSQDNCRFDLGFHIESREYVKWYESVWGVKPYSATIWATNQWGIPNWPAKPRKVFFGLVTKTTGGVPKDIQLRNVPEDADEMNLLLEAIRGPGLKKIEPLNSFESIANDILTRTFHEYGSACDLFMAAGNTEKAKDVIQEGIRQATEANNMQTSQVIQYLKEQQAKYFPTG